MDASIVPVSELTPGMAQVLDRIRRARQIPFHLRTPAEARSAYERAAEVLDVPRAPVTSVDAVMLPGGQGLRPARRYRMHTGVGPQPTLLYLHGGGFTIGGLETHDSLCRQWAVRTGATVVALDYRLAPEHRFPAAVDDVCVAVESLATPSGPVAAALEVDPGRLVVAGDSAGGTLAAVAALWARDHGVALAGQLLITPGTTAYADTDSHRRYGEGFLLDAETVEWFFDHYIAGPDRTDWRFAPLLATSHAGLAPAAVLLAACDPLRDEGRDYARALQEAGGDVMVETVAGVVHDFIKMGRVLPQALEAQAWCAQRLRKWWGME